MHMPTVQTVCHIHMRFGPRDNQLPYSRLPSLAGQWRCYDSVSNDHHDQAAYSDVDYSSPPKCSRRTAISNIIIAWMWQMLLEDFFLVFFKLAWTTDPRPVSLRHMSFEPDIRSKDTELVPVFSWAYFLETLNPPFFSFSGLDSSRRTCSACWRFHYCSCESYDTMHGHHLPISLPTPVTG